MKILLVIVIVASLVDYLAQAVEPSLSMIIRLGLAVLILAAFWRAIVETAYSSQHDRTNLAESVD